MPDTISQIEDEAPKTVKELGIHLSYVRRDIAKLTVMMESLPNGFATKEELRAESAARQELEKQLDDITKRNNSWYIKYGVPAIWSLVGAVILVLVLSFLNQLKGQ